MKQRCDDVRMLAIDLFEAAQREKRKQIAQVSDENGFRFEAWSDLADQSVAIWDAVAAEAYRRLRR